MKKGTKCVKLKKLPWPNPQDVGIRAWDAIGCRLLRNPHYKDRKVTFTRAELIEFYERNWGTYLPMYQAYEASGFKRSLAPSVDRIDNNGDYTLANIQLLTFADNLSKDKKGVKKSPECIERMKNNRYKTFVEKRKANPYPADVQCPIDGCLRKRDSHGRKGDPKKYYSKTCRLHKNVTPTI